MSSNYKVINKKLTTNDFTVDFEYNIQNVVFWDNIYVILLSIPNEVNEIDNIYGVSISGEVIWRIESPIKAFKISKDEQGYEYMALSTYVLVNLSADGVFMANTFGGMRYTFDYKTGKLLKQVCSRW